MKRIGEKDDDAESEGKRLPRVTQDEILQLAGDARTDGTTPLVPVRPEQHFTEPPPRYTEATLVKELEEKGIGRPSTYAAIISTIVEREYVTKEQGHFPPTMLGEKVSNLLVKSFEDIFDTGFTARMEEELDEIEEGKLPVEGSCGRILRTLRKRFGTWRATKWNRTSAEFLPRKNVRSAVREICWSASAATDFSWDANATRIAITRAIFLLKFPRTMVKVARTWRCVPSAVRK